MTHRLGAQRRREALSLIIVISLLVAGAIIWGLVIAPRYTVRITPEAQVAISRRGPTDEPVPTLQEKQAYTVPADAPRYLRISKIGVEARVLGLGRDSEGRIGVPPGIWDVAWYTGSAKPGEAGVTFIDGHISGPNLPAVFKDLHRLASGDSIQLERGDGSRLNYTVRTVETKSLATINMDELLTTPIDDKTTLILMTCGGNFDARDYSYDHRAVVVATQA